MTIFMPRGKEEKSRFDLTDNARLFRDRQAILSDVGIHSVALSVSVSKRLNLLGKNNLLDT